MAGRDEDMELNDKGAKLAGQLLAETREELGRADAKAQILFAVAGVVIGVVLGGILSDGWRPGDLSCGAEVLWWAGVAAVAIGVGALVYALWPRLGKAEVGRVRYFGDIRPHKRCTTLIPDLNGEAARKDRDAEQLLVLAPIVWEKYVAIKVAISGLSVGAIFTIIAAVIG